MDHIIGQHEVNHRLIIHVRTKIIRKFFIQMTVWKDKIMRFDLLLNHHSKLPNDASCRYVKRITKVYLKLGVLALVGGVESAKNKDSKFL